MHTNKMLLTLLASVVLPLSGVACGGSSEPVGADDADHVTPAPSASSQDDAGAPSSNGNGGASTGNDAGATTTSGNDAGTS
ncbi:MAG TPA: hypothetical protein VF407_23320, partial [Polyangiaceae bacterium]